jgi:hypothetical protein
MLISETFWYTLVLAVTLFGVGYYTASRELTRNRVIVWLGAAGKLGLAAPSSSATS